MINRFSEIPYDVFSTILELTDVECLFAMGQCNRRYREWAGSTLLWKEVIRRMQEHGTQLPAEGFIGIENMSFSQLKHSALRAFRFRQKWSSREARPTQAILIDCSPSRYAHGVFHPIQRLRWVIPINADFFAVKLGYHLSSGFLQIWRREGYAPQIIVNWHSDWVGWGSCTDLDNKAWYFIYSEHSMNQHGHTLHLMKFTGFDSNPGQTLDMLVVAKYPTYGSLINYGSLYNRLYSLVEVTRIASFDLLSL